MQERFVINIGRRYGSGGKRIGELIAERLGIRLYDRELINLAAEQSGFGVEHFEQADEQEHKGVLSTLLGHFRTPYVGSFVESGSPLSNDALFKIQSDAIRSVAERESCIFVGRCADYILRDHPRSLNIFLTADDPDRVARICGRTGCTEAEARQTMAHGDARRADYYNYYSMRTWGAAATYDLCANTSVLGIEATAELILRFAARKLDLKTDL